MDEGHAGLPAVLISAGSLRNRGPGASPAFRPRGAWKTRVLPSAGGSGRCGTISKAAGGAGMAGSSTTLIGVAERLAVVPQAVSAEAVSAISAILFNRIVYPLFFLPHVGAGLVTLRGGGRRNIGSALIGRALGGAGWLVKAQVHAGGRGKAGGVKLVSAAFPARSRIDAGRLPVVGRVIVPLAATSP